MLKPKALNEFLEKTNIIMKIAESYSKRYLYEKSLLYYDKCLEERKKLYASEDINLFFDIFMEKAEIYFLMKDYNNF